MSCEKGNSKNKLRLKVMNISILLLCIAAGLFFNTSWQDTDFFHLITTGRNIVNKGITHTNYSNLLDLKLVAQQWLYAGFIDVIYEHFGSSGMLILNEVFFLITYFIIMSIIHINTKNNHCRNNILKSLSSSSFNDNSLKSRLSNNYNCFADKNSLDLSKPLLFISSLIVTVTFIYNNIRPEWITLDLILIQILICENFRIKYYSYKCENSDNINQNNNNNLKSFKLSKAMLFLLPLLTLIEINVHSSYWIFHFVYLLPYFVPSFTIIINNIKRKISESKAYSKDKDFSFIFNRMNKPLSYNVENSRLPIKYFILPMTLMLCSLFVNPYGTDAILYLFKSYGEIRNLGITELSSTPMFQITLSVIPLLITVILMLKSQLNSSHLYIMLGTFILCYTSVKNSAWFPIGFIFMTICLMNSNIISRISITINNTEIKLKSLIYYITASLIIIVLSIMNVVSCFSNDEIYGLERYPIYEAIRENINCDKSDNIFTSFNVGAYVEFLGYDNIYIDARPELYSKKLNGEYDLLQEYKNINKGFYSNGDRVHIDYYEDFVNKYNFECMIVDGAGSKGGLYWYLTSQATDRYEMIYENYSIAIFNKIQ